MECYIVYKITNAVNNKSYIGRTKDLERRIKQHINKPHCTHLHRAIKKYGIDNFSISVLFESSDFQGVVEAERSLILNHGTMTPNGYNLVLETDQGRNPSSVTRKRMSQSNQKRMPKGQSGYTGVKIDKNKKGFLVRVNFEKKTYYKYIKNLEEAAETYDKVALYLRGSECGLNFPHKLSQYLKEDLKAFFQWFCYKPEKSSPYVGVAYHKLLKKWRAYYYENGKQIIVGNFQTPEEAHEVVKKYYE